MMIYILADRDAVLRRLMEVEGESWIIDIQLRGILTSMQD